MKKIILILIGLSFIISSCDDSDTNKRIYNAKVIGKGIDCGETFLIEFHDDVSGLPENSFDKVYYALNLPNEFKIEGKNIYVEFREPKNTELMPCHAFGPAYPHIYITNIE